MTDGKRVYRSSLRAEQAARTRDTVVDAAARCFLRDGYAATTMKQISAEAGVALQTVFAQGNKASLLLAVVDRAVAGADEHSPVREQAYFAAMVTPRDKRTKLAALRRAVESRRPDEAAVLREFRRAAGSDEEIAAAWVEYESRRLADIRVLVGSFEHLLRDGLDVDRATDVFWAVFTTDTADMFVRGRGWSTAQYAEWLADAVDRLLLR